MIRSPAGWRLVETARADHGTGRQLHQLKNVAPVQRQFVDLLLVDHRIQRGRASVHRHRIGGDVHGFG